MLMKKIFMPVLMLAMFAFGGAQAQTNQAKAPITVKKSPVPVSPVTKAPPITVTKAPPVMSAPVTARKPVIVPVAKPVAPAAKPVKTVAPVAKPTAVKKTAAPVHHKKAVAKKVKHIAPPPPPPAAPAPPPPPPVTEEVILPRPVAPQTMEVEKVIVNKSKDMDDEDNDGANEKESSHSSCCESDCHHYHGMDKFGDQPWRFRHRHYTRYSYINSFYDRQCGDSKCEKGCSHHDEEKKKDNDD
jgi:hypothetical protein